jgi:hypothetical protein
MRPGAHLFAGVFAVAACAALGPLERQPDFGSYFTLRLADRTEQARLESRRLYGPELELDRMPDGYRGQVEGKLIDLRTNAEKILGTVGNGATDLAWEVTGDSLFLTGLYAGRLGELEVRADRLRGSIGGCTYDMSRHPDAAWYRGSLACGPGRGTGGAELAFPASLASLPPAEQGVLLAVFLAR